jgi:hypothetical protein
MNAISSVHCSLFFFPLTDTAASASAILLQSCYESCNLLRGFPKAGKSSAVDKLPLCAWNDPLHLLALLLLYLLLAH